MTYTKRQPRVQRTCGKCGRSFTVTAYILRKRPRLYCSMPCALEARRKAKTKVPCATCGKILVLSPWETRRAKVAGHFCSQKCYGQWRSINLSGDASPNWKGGKSVHYLGGWKKARVHAKQRDNYTCQDCGKTRKPNDRLLDVHHISPYENFEIPKEAHVLSNLISLCRLCHSRR